mmetsp:Transcript_19795/g.25646  ORF Transcript_19795/g.25646 Transcript_19795/m.25646 type:complete len:963 (+) Transcript_19795:648-3536(+)
MEVARPIIYAVNRSINGKQSVHKHVGYEPSGRAFDDIALNSEGLPHNPYSAAGAIMCSAQIFPEKPQAERFDYIMNVWNRLLGGDVAEFNNSQYLTLKQHSDQDHCLAYLMKETGALPEVGSIAKNLEFYFMNLSVEMTTRKLSYVASCLAFNGICPFTGEQIFASSVVRDCLSLMSSCGSNDYSGMFQFDIGFPSKTSSSGIILGVIPNVLGFCTYHPKVNSELNSLFGLNVCKSLVSRFKFHVFDSISNKNAMEGNEECKIELRKLTDEQLADEDHISFLYAAYEGDLSQLRRLVARGVDVNKPDYDFRRAIHIAACENHKEVVQYLMNVGASVDIKDRYGSTPLDDAIRENNPEIEKLLENPPKYVLDNAVIESQSHEVRSSSAVENQRTRIEIQEGIMRSRSVKDFSELVLSVHESAPPVPSRRLNNPWLNSLVHATLKSQDGSNMSPKINSLFQLLDSMGLHHVKSRILSRIDSDGSTCAFELGETVLTEKLLEDLNKDIPLIGKALEGRLIIRDWKSVSNDFKNIYEKCLKNTSGQTAQYIPQLANVPPEQFGVGITSVHSQTFSCGDADTLFCIQSCCKTVNYCIALELNSREMVHKHIGREPSGRNFNELALDKNNLPHNPLINAGAIMACSLIMPESDPAERFDYVCGVWEELTGGQKPVFSNETYLSELETADRNFCLGYLMKEKGAFPSYIDSGDKLLEVLEFYFQVCSLQVTSKALSVAAATLANGGINPISNKRIFKQETVRDCLSIMSSSGMYDYSGAFQFSIGTPCKSGVAGAIMMVIPNVAGICTWSPRLDKIGNSVRGVEFCHRLSQKFPIHMFDNLEGNGDRRGNADDGKRGASEKKTLLKYKHESVEMNLAYLAYAAAIGDLAETMRLVTLCADINQGDYDGRTILHLAASEGQLKVVRYLLNSGAQVDRKDRWGGTPISDARKNGHEKTYKLLLSAQTNEAK